MADWNAPVVATAYALAMTNLKDRDVESATMFSVSTPTNTPTGAIKLDAASTSSTLQKWSGTAWVDAFTTFYAPAFSSNGNAEFGSTITTGVGISTGSCLFELGGGRTGDGSAFIDIHTTSGTNYDARISRAGGVNGAAYFFNTGTGGLFINQQGAGSIVLSTTSTERLRIDQDGNILVGTATANRGATGRGLIEINGSSSAMMALRNGGTEVGYLLGTSSGVTVYSTTWFRANSVSGHILTVNGTEMARLTPTGLGIGTTTPAGALEVKGNVTLIEAWAGTTGSPTEAITATTPALSVGTFGAGTSRIAQAWSFPADPLSFSDNSQWNLRLSQTANSTTSAGVTGATLAGPGFLALGAGGAERMRILSGGNVGIAKTNPTVALDVNGAITATGDITAYSDVRLKENIVHIHSALEKVKRLHGVTFDRIDREGRSVGLLAQDVQAVLPEAVRDDGEFLSVNYNGLIGLLVEAIKELAQ